MSKTVNTPEGQCAYKPLIQFEIGSRSFVSLWVNCDHISTYLAKMVSHNRIDSVRHTNLVSSAINELLEVAFRTRNSGGDIQCLLSRSGGTDRIELVIPCTAEEKTIYQDTCARIARPGQLEQYLSSVARGLVPSREMILSELIVNHQASLQLNDTSDDAVKLVVDLPLEESSH